MKIKIERSGGLTGIVTSNEIDAKNLPTAILKKVHEVLNDNQVNPMKSIPKGAADHFNYRITFEEGKKNKVIECNQFDLKEDLKDIVKFVEANSKKS